MLRIKRRLRATPRKAAGGLAMVATALAFATLLARPAAGQPFFPAPVTATPGATSTAQTISATGQGTASLPPDKAVISASVQTEATAASDALDQNSRTVAAVIAAVKAQGVGDAGIQTTQLTLYPVYASSTTCNQGQPPLPYGTVYGPAASCDEPSPPPTVSYFQVTEGLSVTTTDLSNVPVLVEAMVGAGITQFSGIQYGWQNPEQLQTMAIQAASADAQREAQTLAASLGVTLGPVLSSSLVYSSAPPLPAVPAPPPPTPAGVPRPALPALAPPLQPGQQSANASVSVTFAIAGR